MNGAEDTAAALRKDRREAEWWGLVMVESGMSGSKAWEQKGCIWKMWRVEFPSIANLSVCFVTEWAYYFHLYPEFSL